MRDPRRRPFGAVVGAEVLFNSKRPAPYVLVLLFSATALFWWGMGPATYFGWAPNSDFFIVRLLSGFTFLTLPFAAAVLMSDPILRDFDLRVDPLIFTKPLHRLEYILGKFLGNFVVLVLCQASFVVTLVVLQWFRTSEMVVLPARTAPYLKHFLFFAVLSSLLLGAVCFTVGTLARSVKVVYALVTSSYLLYVGWQMAMRDLPTRWRLLLDPLLMDSNLRFRGRGAEWLNQLSVGYSLEMVLNRAAALAVAALCLGVLHARFSRVERYSPAAGPRGPLGIDVERRRRALDWERERFGAARRPAVRLGAPARAGALPAARKETAGARAGLRSLLAACGVEFRLLLAERSPVVVLPLATLVTAATLAYYDVPPEPSYAVAYAARTADSFLLFLLLFAVFYTGEAMHRDRRERVEPLLWSAPAPDGALLLSKFLTMLALSAGACALATAAAMGVQAAKGHAPVEPGPYLFAVAAILVPCAAFATALVVLLNVVLREKYLAYAASLAIAGALYLAFGSGHDHWLYNPALYGLWSDWELPEILAHRAYVLALAGVCLALAHLAYPRRR